MAATSAERIANIFNNNCVAQAAFREGHIAKQGSADNDIILPTAANNSDIVGVVMSAGQQPTGASASDGSERLPVQMLGKTKVLVDASSVCVAGAYCIPSGSVLGQGAVRTAYSSSNFIIGKFAQGRTVGATAEFVEVDLLNYWLEVIQPVTAHCTGAVGAATKYMTAPGQGVAAAQIPLYVATYACTIRNLRVSLATAPAGADTCAFTVQKSSDNAASYTDTTLTATISGAGKSANDLSHAVAIAAGDILAIKMVSSAVTAAAPCATFQVT